MRDIIVAKRGKGIDDVVKGLTPQLPDSIKKIVPPPSRFQGLHERFKLVIAEYEKDKYQLPYLYASGIMDRLPPKEINTFLQTTIIHEDNQYYPAALGRVASRLVEYSYKAGYNNFILDVRNLQRPFYLLNNIYADHKKPLIAVVHGDAGDDFASESINLHVTIHGNVGENSAQSRDCTITLHGTVGGYNFGLRGENIVIKTSNEKTLMEVIQMGIALPPHEVGISHVYFIKPDGTEQLVRHYNRIFPWR